MFFDQPSIHDALVQYISPKDNLHAVCKCLHELYRSCLFFLKVRKGYSGFISFPAHKSTIGSKLRSLITQESFVIDLSCLSCFEQIVYAKESRLETQDMFAKMKQSIQACTQQIYIDCHWVGYIATTPAKNGEWIVNPLYQKDSLRTNVAFDFDLYEQELNLYLTDWPNLKELHLFQPYRRNMFLQCLYARTKCVIDRLKVRLANPHHLKIIEVSNEGLDEIECIENSLRFLRNVDSRCKSRTNLDQESNIF